MVKFYNTIIKLSIDIYKILWYTNGGLGRVLELIL